VLCHWNGVVAIALLVLLGCRAEATSTDELPDITRRAATLENSIESLPEATEKVPNLPAAVAPATPDVEAPPEPEAKLAAVLPTTAPAPLEVAVVTAPAAPVAKDPSTEFFVEGRIPKLRI